jgi:hypothetical protein
VDTVVASGALVLFLVLDLAGNLIGGQWFLDIFSVAIFTTGVLIGGYFILWVGGLFFLPRRKFYDLVFLRLYKDPRHYRELKKFFLWLWVIVLLISTAFVMFLHTQKSPIRSEGQLEKGPLVMTQTDTTAAIA